MPTRICMMWSRSSPRKSGLKQGDGARPPWYESAGKDVSSSSALSGATFTLGAADVRRSKSYRDMSTSLKEGVEFG